MTKRKQVHPHRKCKKCKRFIAQISVTEFCNQCTSHENKESSNITERSEISIEFPISVEANLIERHLPLVNTETSEMAKEAETLVEPSISIESEPMVLEDESCSLLYCENCHRDGIAEIIVQTREGIGISFKKKLCMMIKKKGQMASYDLCNECYTMLGPVVESNSQKSNTKYNWVNCWPAFFWFLFQHPKNQEFVSLLWHLIPITMRQPWLRNFKSLSAVHEKVTLKDHPPMFQDITALSAELKALKDSYTFANLIEWSNQMYFCRVKCPWGCSEFLDEVGFVAFHKLVYTIGNTMNMEFPVMESSISALGYNQELQYTGILSDILESGPSYFLLSHKAPIWYSMKFVDKLGPMVCTCKRHDKGSKFHYLHPPTNPLTEIRPSSVGDPISQVALAPRTVTTIKTEKQYSTTYQMQQCYTGFRGSDCCDVKEVGKFDKNNQLSRLNACLAYYGRSDIRANVHQMVQSNIVPQLYEDALVEEIQSLKLSERETELREAQRRSTRMNLLDALKVNYHVAHSQKLPFQPSWPTVLAMCHPSSASLHGFVPPHLPSSPRFNMKKHDYRLLFCMLSMATTVPPLWECIGSSVRFEGALTWHGWFLTFATKNLLKEVVLKTYEGKMKSPYLIQQKKAVDLAWILQCCSETGWMLTNTNDTTFTSAPKNFAPAFNLQQLHNLFQSIKNCVVGNHLENVQKDIDESTAIAIVFFTSKNHGEYCSSLLQHFAVSFLL
jgi:hypothetical protein